MAAKQKKAKKAAVNKRTGVTRPPSLFSHAATGIQASKNAPAKSTGSLKSGSNSGAVTSLFESRWTKSKFDVLGKKRRSSGIRVGLSRSAAIEKRKRTILHEFQSRGKVNVFLDHRFGEDDETLGEEDKAILRFQRERQTQLQKKSKFTLPDEEEEEEAILTHNGTALSNIDDFEDDFSEDDDADKQELDEELVKKFHFGGEFNSEHTDKSERVKSKKEIMEEIIAKSKFYKVQKAKEKEEDSELKDKLDKEFAILAQSQALSSLVRPKKANALRKMLSGKSSEIDLTVDEKADDFDKLVKEMGMEMRAHASDRLKTDEEIAEEERAHLEELEDKRRKRMHGEMDSEDSDTEKSDTRQLSRDKKRKKSEISGDDLGENFQMEDDDDEKKVGWVDEVLARNGDNDESENGTGEEDDGSIDDDEDKTAHSSEDDENSDELSGSCSDASEEKGSDDDSWERSDEDDELVSSQSMHKQEFSKQQSINTSSGGADSPHLSHESELPFVIDAPKNFEELKVLVENRSVADLLLAVQRIRTCNSVRLAAENRRKMQVFYGLLLQYFSYIASRNVPPVDKLNALVKPLLEMTSDTPYFAAVCARERIIRMHNQLVEKLKNPSLDGPWPSYRSLVLLRLWSMIFPTSDFRHVVITPSILLLTEYLMRCPVGFAKELAIGTFVCGLLLNIMRPARRFCPEALSFLYAALFSSLPKKNVLKKAHHHGCGAFMLGLVASQPWLMLQNDCSQSKSVDDLDFTWLMIANRDHDFFSTDELRLSILKSILGTLAGFSHIYEDIVCYPEIFGPFVTLLQCLLVNKYLPQPILELLNKIIDQMNENIHRQKKFRQPLRMRIKKPVPIKQFNPKFEENFVRGKNYDPDRERAERKKLQRLLKQEAKGAARELRKDNYFLLTEKTKEKAVLEQQREEKYRKAMAFLQEQEAAFKSGQLGKGRRKRR